MKNISVLAFISYLFYVLVLSSCAVRAPNPMTAPSSSAESERPGLATQWGETRTSRVKNTHFNRANHTPTALTTLYYNNREGITTMLGISRYQPGLPTWLQVNPYNFVSIGIRGERGQFLENFTVDGKKYVIGENGHRYSILVRNNTNTRLETVLSVDGLDVLDGKPASVTKPGYVIAPYATLTVDGFRQNMEAVAAFRFGTMADSYTEQKYGDTTNAGVIGVAIFHELGSQPFSQWTNHEVQKRHAADPFPERFATPP